MDRAVPKNRPRIFARLGVVSLVNIRSIESKNRLPVRTPCRTFHLKSRRDLSYIVSSYERGPSIRK